MEIANEFDDPADAPERLDEESVHWIEAHRVRGVHATLDSLTGLVRAKRAVRALAWGLAHPAELRAAGGTVPPGVLLVGPPGCGKTSLARALAGLLGERALFIELAASELGPERIGAISRYTERLDRPAVIFLDEVSWLGADRSDRRHDGASRGALFAVLAAVSGVRERRDPPVVWIAATSEDPDSLDPALTRPGRFSHVVEVAAPDAATRREHLERLLAVRRTSGPIDLSPIVEATTGSSFAGLDQLVDDALALSLADAADADATARSEPGIGSSRRYRRLGGIDQAHLADAALASGRVPAARDRTPDEAWTACVHEAGHALAAAAGALGLEAVRAVSVEPRVSGHSGGHTTIGAERDEGSARPLTDAELRAHVTCALAAGVAERLVLGQASTGTAEDATHAGQLLLTRLDSGLDPLWPVAWPSWIDLGPGMADRRGALLAASMERCHAEAEALLERHRMGLERLARRLLEVGHLEGAALRAALVDALEADEMGDAVPGIA